MKHTHEAETDPELSAAVEVYRARCRIDDAVADLAASPLDEPAAARMRAALADPTLATAREALLRLSPRRPTLQLLPGEGSA